MKYKNFDNSSEQETGAVQEPKECPYKAVIDNLNKVIDSNLNLAITALNSAKEAINKLFQLLNEGDD